MRARNPGCFEAFPGAVSSGFFDLKLNSPISKFGLGGAGL
jgi:hypothetical protein